MEYDFLLELVFATALLEVGVPLGLFRAARAAGAEGILEVRTGVDVGVFTSLNVIFTGDAVTDTLIGDNEVGEDTTVAGSIGFETADLLEEATTLADVTILAMADMEMDGYDVCKGCVDAISTEGIVVRARVEELLCLISGFT